MQSEKCVNLFIEGFIYQNFNKPLNGIGWIAWGTAAGLRENMSGGPNPRHHRQKVMGVHDHGGDGVVLDQQVCELCDVLGLVMSILGIQMGGTRLKEF